MTMQGKTGRSASKQATTTTTTTTMMMMMTMMWFDVAEDPWHGGVVELHMLIARGPSSSSEGTAG